MEHHAQVQRIYYVLELISKGRACTPHTIASRMNVSDRTARRVIKKLRDKGHEIGFCRLQKRYVLKNKEE
jgi:ribosomal protein S25